jgi:hypothetical protein
MATSPKQRQISIVLFLIRISIFIVLAMWTIDKFYRPDHAAAVFDHFYGLAGLGTHVVYVLAFLEAVLLVAFILGIMQKFTYGTVLLLHSISTLASFQQYLHPFDSNNLLFFAAWPMLAACYALYTLRDLDTWRIGR